MSREFYGFDDPDFAAPSDDAVITDADRANADELCSELGVDGDTSNIQAIAEWFRKIRHEAVLAERGKRSS